MSVFTQSLFPSPSPFPGKGRREPEGRCGFDDEGVVGGGVADADADATGEGVFQELAADFGAPAGEQAGEHLAVAAGEVPIDQAAEVTGAADEAGGDFALDADGFQERFQGEGEHAGLAGGAAVAAVLLGQFLGREVLRGLNGVEQSGAVAVGQALHAADALQVVKVGGGGLGGGDDEVVAEDAPAWEITRAGEVLTPEEEFADGGEVAPAELLGPGDAPPAVLGELCEELVVAVVGFVVEPGQAGALIECGAEGVAEGDEVVDVVRGVGELAIAEGASHPVAAGLALFGVAVEDGADEAVIGDGEAVAEEAGGDLDIEDVGGEGSGFEPAEA